MVCKCVQEVNAIESKVEEESFAAEMVKCMTTVNKRIILLLILMTILFTGYLVYDNVTSYPAIVSTP